MPAQQHVPQQQRSREKVDRILAATAELLEAVPYGELGTKAIAARAGVSVGVLYRYFADKDAILMALGKQYLHRDVEIADGVTADPLPATPGELLGRLLTAYADRFRREPGYRMIWYHAPRLPGLTLLGRDTDIAIAERLHAALTRGYGFPAGPEARGRIELAVGTGADLLDRAFRDHPHGNETTLREGELMLRRYLFP